jgi:hypothetical protein
MQRGVKQEWVKKSQNEKFGSGQGRISWGVHGVRKVSIELVMHYYYAFCNSLMAITGLPTRRAGGQQLYYYPLKYPVPYAFGLGWFCVD